MNIIHVIESRNPQRIDTGNVNHRLSLHQATALATAMHEQGHAAVIMDMPKQRPYSLQSLLTRSKWGSGSDSDARIREVLQAITKKQPDIIHDHTGKIVSSPWYHEQRREVPWSLVTTLYQLPGEPLSASTINRYKAHNSLDALIALSQEQKLFFGDMFPIDSVIAPGIDCSQYREQRKEGFLLAYPPLDKKGEQTLQTMGEASPQLILVASPTSNTALNTYHGKTIIPLGTISPEEKKNLLGKAKGFLYLGQDKKTFGLDAMKALASGTPVIAAADGYMQEIIQDGKNGFMINNAEQGIAALSRLWEIDGTYCRTNAEERFNINHQAKKYLEVYDSLAKLHPSRKSHAFQG